MNSVKGRIPSQEEFETKKENNLKWLKKKGIEIKSLPKSNPENFVYTCDSTLLLKRTSGDTIFWHFTGSESYFDTVFMEQFISNEAFGKTWYFSGVNYQGNLALTMLKPATFLIKGDSLFEKVTFSSLSVDSIDKLYDVLIANMDIGISQDSIHSIISKNKYYKFKLIFHPNIFNNGPYLDNLENDSIVLNERKELDGNTYYKISIHNWSGKTKTVYSYHFSDQFKFLIYDGCNSEILRALKKQVE